MNRIKSWLPSGRFARSVALLGGGTAAAYALAAAASPVITRLYTPTDFGALGVYVSITAILTVIVSWRYEMAIPVPEDDQTAADLMILTLCLLVGMSVLLGGGVWLFGDWLAARLDAPALAPYLWLTPLSLLTGGVYQVLQYWAVRKKAFSTIAQTKLWQGVGVVATQIGLGLLVKGPIGLMLGNVVQQSAGNTSLGRRAWRDVKSGDLKVSLSRMMRAANRYRRFPMYSSWAALLNASSVQIPFLFLSAFFGGTTTGLYALTSQVLWTPMRLVGAAIGQVFFSSASEARIRGATAEVTFNVYQRLLEIVMPFVLLLVIAAPELFGLVFGTQWSLAGTYARWLTPWLLFVFVASPLSSLVLVLERQHGELIFQACLIAGRVLALLAGGYLGEPMIAIAFYGLTSAVIWFVYLIWMLKLSGTSVGSGVAEIGRQVVRALPLIVPAAAGRFLLGGTTFTVAGATITVALAGIRIARRLRRRGAE